MSVSPARAFPVAVIVSMKIMDKENFLNNYTGHFNDKQREAVETVDGKILLLAVPGSGKTTVLVTRLGYMLYVKDISPENILTLTYTVAATNDMARRFESIFGGEYSGRLEFRTINGICARIINQYGKMIGKRPFSLLSDDKGAGWILIDILKKYLSEYPTESEVKNAQTLIAYCKNMMLTEDEIEKLGETVGIPLSDIFRDYSDTLKKNQLMDYDDQMVYAYRILMRQPDLQRYYREKYRYICVDEAQDTSKIQHYIIALLAGPDGNLFMVGDEDQSIYGFRAAYPEALLDFEKNHAGARILIMDRNYRSNAKIVAAADAFIRLNEARHDKHMAADRGEGSEISYIELRNRAGQYAYLVKVADACRVVNGAGNQIGGVPSAADSPVKKAPETAVLYRNNESVLPLVDRLERQGIPYRIKSMDMSFFTSRVVMDITNIMRFALNPKSTDLFMQIYFKCQTFLRKDQAEKMCRISRKRDIPVLEAAGYVKGINGMVLGKCRGLATNLQKMTDERPSKGIFRIEKPCGYGEYLERNNIDDNKLFVLRQLSFNETTLEGFLERLAHLQSVLRDTRQDYSCPFVLSTIHSSKGLEYERVFLMDVCDGVFPSQVPKNKRSATPQEKKQLEEERRLFYVGITRAIDQLSIFKFPDNPSTFVHELTSYRRSEKKQPEYVPRRDVSERIRPGRTHGGNDSATNLNSNYELIIGMHVMSEQYGAGVITDVEYDREGCLGKSGRFCVEFETGEERVFAFPLAFKRGMWLNE